VAGRIVRVRVTNLAKETLDTQLIGDLMTTVLREYGNTTGGYSAFVDNPDLPTIGIRLDGDKTTINGFVFLETELGTLPPQMQEIFRNLDSAPDKKMDLQPAGQMEGIGEFADCLKQHDPKAFAMFDKMFRERIFECGERSPVAPPGVRPCWPLNGRARRQVTRRKNAWKLASIRLSNLVT
jgi:hypothetical protein